MILYTIRYARAVTQAIYLIERGLAGEVTLAIRTLSQEPRPFKSFPLEDLPAVFVIKVSGYFITYRINEETRTIIIAEIEKVQTEN